MVSKCSNLLYSSVYPCFPLVFSSLHPFQGGRKSGQQLPLHSFPPPNLLSNFRICCSRKYLKGDQTLPSPKMTRKKELCDPGSCRKKKASLLTSLPPFLTLYLLVALLHPNFRMSRTSWDCSCWLVLSLKQWGLSSKEDAFLKVEI